MCAIILMASVATQQQISFANGAVIALGKLPSIVCHFDRTSISSYYDGSDPNVYALKQFSARNGHEQVHVNERKNRSEKFRSYSHYSLTATDHDLETPYLHEISMKLQIHTKSWKTIRYLNINALRFSIRIPRNIEWL